MCYWVGRTLKLQLVGLVLMMYDVLALRFTSFPSYEYRPPDLLNRSHGLRGRWIIKCW